MSSVNSLLCLMALLCSCAGQSRKVEMTDPLRDRILTFWDSRDVGGYDAGTKEQNIVDYLFLMQHSDSLLRKDAWEELHSALDNELDRTVVDYLGESDSPLYSPSMLEEYLTSLLDRLPDGSIAGAGTAYLLENIRKNRPGEKISDLRLKAPNGLTTTLQRQIHESGKECIILFYDPDCNSCDETISSLAQFAKGQYYIIAVSVIGNAKALPQGWGTWLAADADELEENFYLPSLPAMYVTSPSGIIISRE